MQTARVDHWLNFEKHNFYKTEYFLIATQMEDFFQKKLIF